MAPTKKDEEDVMLGMYIKTGSRCEEDNKSGLAHFLEHMLFRGYNAKFALQTLDNMGADYNAWTFEETVSFLIQVEHAHFETALSILSDMIVRPSFTPEEVEIERGVVLQEMDMYLDNPTEMLLVDWQKLIFGEQPIGCNVVGDTEDVKNLTFTDLMEFWNRFYVPKNMVLVVSGNVPKNVEETEETVDEYFYFPDKRLKPKRVWVPFEKDLVGKKRVNIHSNRMRQAQFILGTLAPSIKNDLTYPAHVLARILGTDFSSRLFMAVREKEGLAYEVSVDHNPYSDTGCFTIKSGVNPKNIDRAIELIARELKDVYVNGISGKELKKVKTSLVAQYRRDFDDIETLTDLMGMHELFFREVMVPEKIIAELDSVTIEDVNKVAKMMFAPENLRLAIIGPLDEDDTERFEKLLKY
ncbi:MAG: pitrilysin family protein [Patescibacteria group bacterium]|nr:pitrilysin family protein [Patescibacteria group bacterium]